VVKVNRRHETSDRNLTEHLGTTGFRLTPQRRQVYDVLLHKRDHPDAEQVFMRAKRAMPEISLATVYNCLDALVKCGLARQVTVDRGATRFCPNMHEHGHFHCDECGTVFDVELPRELPGISLPRGFKPRRYEAAIHGLCADCARKEP
jgi:Fur family peroxide stress response transcriptional regulator